MKDETKLKWIAYAGIAVAGGVVGAATLVVWFAWALRH